MRIRLCHLFENYSLAMNDLKKISTIIGSAFGMFIVRDYNFYDSLIKASFYKDATVRFKKRIIKGLKKNLKRMKKWTHYAPMNNLHCYYLIKAELARLLEKHNDAQELYDKAIGAAIENGFLIEEAIAYETAAKYYLDIGDISKGAEYFNKAYRCFNIWGAKTKIRYMEEKYPQLISFNNSSSKTIDTRAANSNDNKIDTLSSSALDLKSLSEMSGAITSDNDIKNLLNRFMEVIIKNSGAKRGVILTVNNNTFNIEVEGQFSENGIQYHHNKTLHDDDAAVSIIRYTLRTGNKIRINNSHDKHMFSNDEYINTSDLKSVYCIPIIRTITPIGILYLENNLMAGVFTEERSALLDQIATQIAIFLENLQLKESIIEKKGNGDNSRLIESILLEDYRLTKQETTIALLLKEGVTRADVCDELNISYNTLKNHLKIIYDKTINLEDDFVTSGRVDKLSRLILFLYRIEPSR